ncbi:MAG TPA: hypothetical protein VNJ01_17290 [Bacteriovoracaceae bacterium]|nr:hypothetical protein [Bacteriovoracaceae bacterium]
MMSLIFLLLFLPAQALSVDCKEQNLITESESPFQKIPVYDQNGSGTCYAYTTAQLVDFHLIRKGAKERSVHPAWVSLVTARRWFNDTLTDNSSTVKSLVALSELKNCSYATVSKSLATWADKARVTESEILNLIEKYSPILKDMSLEKSSLSDEDFQSAMELALDDHRSCTGNPAWDQLLPQLRALRVMSSPDMLSKLILPTCETSKHAIKIPKPKYELLTEESAIIGKIANKLDRLKSPVAITYCANVWRDPTYTGLKNRPMPAADCGQHASIVVGKKMIGGACHLLVRNTWGKEFDSNNKKWTCLCKHKTTGEFLDNCTNDMNVNKQYDVEGCWIKGEVLSNNISEITTLE